MEYKIFAHEHDTDSVALAFENGMVRLETDGGLVTLSTDEFRQLRKAVGYVWLEIEGSNA